MTIKYNTFSLAGVEFAIPDGTLFRAVVSGKAGAVATNIELQVTGYDAPGEASLPWPIRPGATAEAVLDWDDTDLPF